MDKLKEVIKAFPLPVEIVEIYDTSFGGYKTTLNFSYDAGYSEEYINEYKDTKVYYLKYDFETEILTLYV